MCGISGYIGNENCIPILLKNLYRMEYRGYDSSGLAYINKDKLVVRKQVGSVSSLDTFMKTEQESQSEAIYSNIGIAHTRWATHGKVTETNAHPHIDSSNSFAIIHNGIIENHAELKRHLIKEGYSFESQTDTEVLVQLIHYYYDGNLEEAVRKTLTCVQGTYGIIVLCKHEPDKLIAVRCGSPMVLGKLDKALFIASDTNAITSYTSQVIYPDEGEMITAFYDGRFYIKNLDNQLISKTPMTLNIESMEISKKDFPYFMLKEIYEQPESIKNALRGRLDHSKGNTTLDAMRKIYKRFPVIKNIIITGMGSSYYAGMIGKYLIEEIAHIPVELSYACELRYRNPSIYKNALVIAISQSGETADTVHAIREIKMKNIPILSICNTVMSSIARESDEGIFLYSGPEIGVASTKTFTSEIIVLLLIALSLGRRSHLSFEKGQAMIQEINTVSQLVQECIEMCHESVKEVVPLFLNSPSALYLGRGYNFATALEGSLKLKEVAYIHAEGYLSAELKHGPLALIDNNIPVLFIVPKDALYEKILSNMEEVNARGGKTIAIATKGDTEIASKSDACIFIPPVPNYLSALIAVIPLQLIAYEVAKTKGYNVDRPRNLAKSVTVE